MKTLLVDNETIRVFRAVFAKTEAGRIAFNGLLVDLGYFDDVEASDVEAVVLKNYGTRLLSLLGINHENNAMDVTSALLKIRPIVFKKTEDQD